MNHKKKSVWGSLLLVLIITISGCNQTAPDTTANESDEIVTETNENIDTISLVFGVYTSDKPSEVVKQFQPILNSLEADMSNTLGQPVEISFQVAPTYEEGIANIVNGDVDFSRFGPASYIEAVIANPDLELLALESSNGEKIFYGIIAIHEDSDIETVSDLTGKRFAFGDELSTIGRYLSQAHLFEQGVLASDLSHFEYLGRHDTVGMAVGAGEFDAGALKESTFKKLVEQGILIRELVRFPNVTKPWFAHPQLSPAVLQALQQALLTMDDPAALEALGKDGFLAGSHEDYSLIQDAIENNYLFFENE